MQQQKILVGEQDQVTAFRDRPITSTALCPEEALGKLYSGSQKQLAGREALAA